MSPDSLKRTPLPANVAASHLVVDEDQWVSTATTFSSSGAALLSLWGADDRDRDSRFRVYAAYLLPDEVILVEHVLAATATSYPSLEAYSPVAGRLQRAVRDLLGLSANSTDERPWLRHGGWPEEVFPLRRDSSPDQQYPLASSHYPFLSVAGDGVHEIAVGPVHAGTIEPGNFRLSVVGEKVLRLEERLGYTHKGIAKRFEQFTLQEGHRLAARASGDSAVAFSWAYCAAL